MFSEKILHNKIWEQKHTDQDRKNKEVIEGIPERDLLILWFSDTSLDSGVSFYNMTTWKKNW